MTARFLAPAAVFATLFVASGCGNPQGDEQPQVPEKQAHSEKTKGDLLVGKWKLVKHNVRGLPEGFWKTCEFTKDGKVTLCTHNPLELDDPEGDPRVESGTYRLEGDSLIITLIGPAATLVSTRTISSVTEDKLVSTYVSPHDASGELQVFEYERIVQKL
jgi:hypothetical protein